MGGFFIAEIFEVFSFTQIGLQRRESRGIISDGGLKVV